jgi:hypothetical protein
MASMNGKVKYIRDADPSTEFRAPGLAALTASFTSAALDLKKANIAYWDNGELPWDEIGVQFVAQSLDLTTGDETYVLSLEVSADAAFTVPVEVAKQSVVAVCAGVMLIDADTVKDRLSTAAFIRLKATLAGTTPILGFYAWMIES